MSDLSSFEVCLLTAPGRGAVATVAVRGRGAASAIGRFFSASSGATVAELAKGRIYYGRWNPPTGEEIVACRTAADEFHLHCHGGVSAPQRLLDELAGLGGRIVDWREWSAHKVDGAIEHDAWLALCAARTERTANILLDQMHGALMAELRAACEECRHHDLDPARERLRALLRRASLGLHLIEPYQVVLAGRPNVGKSSLINALVGYERAIVQDTPGTTRDVLTAETAIDGWPVQFSDTAGLRATLDPLEEAGVRRARQQLADCDLVVLVLDASQPGHREDQMLRDEFPSALIASNKCDLVSGRLPADGHEGNAHIATSALTGQGIGDLLRAVGQRLVDEPPPPGAAVPFTRGQTQAISAALAALAQADAALAIACLQRLNFPVE